MQEIHIYVYIHTYIYIYTYTPFLYSATAYIQAIFHKMLCTLLGCSAASEAPFSSFGILPALSSLLRRSEDGQGRGPKRFMGLKGLGSRGLKGLGA